MATVMTAKRADGLTLTRTLPDGTVKAWPRTFASSRDAARAVAYCLLDNGAATKREAQAFADGFSAAPLGSEVTHASGYSFKATRPPGETALFGADATTFGLPARADV